MMRAHALPSILLPLVLGCATAPVAAAGLVQDEPAAPASIRFGDPEVQSILPAGIRCES